MKQSAIRLVIAACFLAAPFIGSAAEDAYPNKPIMLQVGFPPGQTTDTVARLVAERAALKLGQPIVVINKPGQGGSLQLSSFVQQAPDGYTLTIAAAGATVTNQYLYKTVNYKTPDDFTPVGLVAEFPLVLVVRPGLPFDDLAGLIAYAKQHPGKLNYASPGVGTSSHLAMETLKSEAGVSIEHIPYQGSPQAITNLISGDVDIAFDTVTLLHSYISSGKLKALAIGSDDRFESLPEVPTMKESGYGTVPARAWIGFLLPKGAAQNVVKKLSTVFNSILNDAEFKKKLSGLGAVVHTTTPQEYEEMLRRESQNIGVIVKKAGLERK